MVAEYIAKQRVRAAKWTGDNIEEMYELFKGVVDDDPDGHPAVYAEWIEPYFNSYSHSTYGGYFMLVTEFDEFDPDIWILVYEDNEIESLREEEFFKKFMETPK